MHKQFYEWMTEHLMLRLWKSNPHTKLENLNVAEVIARAMMLHKASVRKKAGSVRLAKLRAQLGNSVLHSTFVY